MGDRSCGERRYDHFREELGLRSNVLNDRLAQLTAEGVLDRVPYQNNLTRHEYLLTTKGQALYPVRLSIMAWGDAYKTDTPPVMLTHTPCGHPAALP